MAYGYALIVVVTLAYGLLGMPIQVADGYSNMVTFPTETLLNGTYNQFYQTSYLRPLLWAHQYVIYVIADGNYHEWYRGWHVLQVIVLIVLFVRLLRPATAVDAAAVALGLAVLTGIHTVAGTVREAFPINTFMTVLLCCLGVANLAVGPARWWRDVLAAVIFVFAALTVESGLLVWVVVVAAYLAGARGVSRVGVVAQTLLLVGYFGLRSYTGSGMPGLIERSSGYGFAVRDPAQLIEIFGDNPYPFYAYNVLTSMVSVLWSEPRAGLWTTTKAWLDGTLRSYMVVNVVASTLSTAVLLLFLWRRRTAWLTWRLEPADRLVFVFLGVLTANAVISYPYTKDVIMSPAGVFYAVAVTVAVRDLLLRASRRVVAAVPVALLCLVMSGAWAVRAIGIQIGMRENASAVRDDWAVLEQTMRRERKPPPSPALLRLQNQLQQDAVTNHPGRPLLVGRWLEWFDYH